MFLPQEAEGYVSTMNTREVGLIVVQLGGGRKLTTDRLDYSVGITEICRLGDCIDPSRAIAMLHADSTASWEQAAAILRVAIGVIDQAPKANPLVYSLH
ncbi:hypothetical protein [uncultured Endozoicomonas sp.]|uniref:hypothetical protein n=1 Tax=uncultured Endozoicomonas sp. TaxID=432652 RepID=UPI00260BE54A|nr:hypothetical protein [uncultured Endozoicomonas sp.]